MSKNLNLFFLNAPSGAGKTYLSSLLPNHWLKYELSRPVHDTCNRVLDMHGIQSGDARRDSVFRIGATTTTLRAFQNTVAEGFFKMNFGEGYFCKRITDSILSKNINNNPCNVVISGLGFISNPDEQKVIVDDLLKSGKFNKVSSILVKISRDNLRYGNSKRIDIPYDKDRYKGIICLKNNSNTNRFMIDHLSFELPLGVAVNAFISSIRTTY